VARHIFQARPVRIYTQSNITQASTNVLLFANGVHFNSLLKSKVSHKVYDNLVTFCIKFHVCPPWQYDRNRPGRSPGRTLPNNPFVNTSCIRGNMISLFMHRFNYCQNLPDFIMITSNKVTKYTTIIREILPCYMWAIKEQTIANTLAVFNKGVSKWNCLDEEIKNIKSHFFKENCKIPLFDV
jgi:hypothetical protein